MSFESGVFGGGVGFMPRNSSGYYPNPFGSDPSIVVPDLSSESVQSVDDRHWSWSSLRATFRTHSLGDLYKRYVGRLQNAYFNAYLLLQVVLSTLYIVAILIANQESLDAAVPEVIVHVSLIACALAVFCLICDENLFRASTNAQIGISVLIVFLSVGTDLALSIYFFVNDGIIRTAGAFQTLIVIYFFLPLPRKNFNVALGTLVTLVYLFMYGVYFYDDTHDRFQRIVADFVFYFCGNCVGVYSLFMNEIAIRRAFLDRREYIQSTIKKDYETAQEEQLLLSILPQHVSVQVKQELMEVFREIEEVKASKNRRGSNNNQHSSIMHKKPFSQLFVERHNNVTILYSDIVNFTPLTVTLSPEDLVETLNQLFGEFDDAAKRHDCLRIKLLGDCYYCVSGLESNESPSSRDSGRAKNHAKNCVLFGLEMIDIIKGVRDRLHVNVQMRIGIHTGNIISGLLGIYKWQYDIWSKDVTIAHHMESSGRPGKVHITQQTKDLLGDEFDYEPLALRDKYLMDNKIYTYLIVPKILSTSKSVSIVEENEETEDVSNHSPMFAKSPTRRDPLSPRSSEARVKMTMKKSRLSMLEKRQTDVTGENIGILIRMLGKVDDQMKEAIDKMPLRKVDRQWCGSQSDGVKVNPLLMNYISWDYERKYMTQPDPLFKFYIGCALFVLICMGIIQGVIMPRDHMILWIAFGLGGSYILLLFPFAWVGYVWNRIKDPHHELDSIPDPKNKLIRYFYKVSEIIAQSWILRTGIYLTVAVVLSIFAIIDVIECDNQSLEARILNQECQHPWYFTYNCTLAILGIYGFFRIHFMIKIFICVLSLGAYSSTMFFFRADVFDGINVDDGSSPAIAPVYAHFVYLIRIILLLHIMDRQMEYINRLDFIWKMKLTEEHKEASITHATNAILIHNILPVKIAKMYLDPTRMGQGYSRSYTDVAVMFASIPNFMDFYTETDLNDQGIKCLQLLNEIIVDFDNALFEFEDVEKIKVIGSTYMAACGLEVNERGRSSQSRYASAELCYMNNRNMMGDSSEPSMERRRKSLVTLVKFAAAMMVRLKGINKDAFQDFELRVGIDSGPIIAGVIGAQKPLYDIWGDTVNMASRMDSTGVNGKIQVAEKSANLLMQEGVRCVFRDKIIVKGKKSLIPAYFVKLNDRDEVQFGRKRFLGVSSQTSNSDSEI